MENPVVVEAVIKGVSWAKTLGPYLDLAEKLCEIEIPTELSDAMEQAGRADMTGGFEDIGPEDVAQEMAEIAAEALEQFELGESGDDPGKTTDELENTEIGGRQVEAEIAAIIKLQAEHDLSQAELANDIEKYRNNIIEQYADSPDELQQQLDRFNETALAEQQDLADQQAAELQRLQDDQQLQRAEVQEQQREQEQTSQDETREEEIRQEEMQEEQRQEQEQDQHLEEERQQEAQLQQEQLRDQMLQEQARQEQEQERLRLEEIRLQQIRLEELRRAQAARDAMER
ncbi:hypothetical protein [Mycobacterium asiaticum]|nr:hypothetical protein [Mycobacterium asiaticum]